MSKNKYGTPQEGEMTARKWGDKGYKPKEGAKGTQRWLGFNVYTCYNENEVEYVGIEAIKEERRASRRAADAERRKREKEERRRMEAIAEAYGDCHTSYQWLNKFGRIPLPGAKWIGGCKEAGMSEDYYYCSISDTRLPESDEELQRIIEAEDKAYQSDPQAYNGKSMTI